jgi:chromosome segregation ATPase
MQDIAELERRITSALERIGKGLEALPAPVEPEPAPEPVVDTAALDALQAALEEERTVNAQLTERLRAVKERDAQTIRTLEAQVEKTTRQLDVQGIELQRMRQTTIQLREHVRALREAQETGQAEPALLNKAMQSELEALRVARSAELAEMDEILAALAPLITEVAEDA